MVLTKVTYSMVDGALVNVLDYGADPTGASDSSAAFQSAVNANLGGQIRVPAGTYRFDTTVQMDVSGLAFVNSVCQFYGDGMTNTIIDNQTGGPAFFVTSGTGNNFAYNFLLKDLSIVSTGTNPGTIGVRMDGCRFATLDNVQIEGMALHGVYGVSTVGDFTDTAQIEMRQCQIQSCGGYGVYAQCDDNAIQYAWNMHECRIGLNQLGGALLESMVNAELAYSGFYYNKNFGVRIIKGSGTAPTPRQNHIDHCEFDTNDGVQIDLPFAAGTLITTPYLISNSIPGIAFTKGIVVGADAKYTVIEQASPRLDPSVTGVVVMEFVSGCVDVAVRDTNYTGFTGIAGTMYVDNSGGQVYIDDVNTRVEFETGTWAVTLTNVAGTVTSPTTKTGYYSKTNNLVTVTFRNFNDVDISGFSPSDVLAITLPFACKIADVGSIGSCIITSDAGTEPPLPQVDNGASRAVFMRQKTGSFVIASNLTSGTSDIKYFTLTYITN